MALLAALPAAAQDLPQAGPVLSTNLPTRSLTLDEAIRTALEHNLDVQVQRLAPVIAQYNLSGSYAVYEPTLNLAGFHSFRSQPGGTDEFGRPKPNREVETDSFSGSVLPGVSGVFPTGLQYRMDANLNHSTFTPPDFEEYSGSWTVRLEQPLLRDSWIDAGRAQILIGKKNLAIAELALLGQIMLTIHNVEQAYHNLIFARENVRVQRTALELAERSLLETRKKVEAGTLPQLDIKQAEAQVATSKADLLTAERNLALQQNILKSLLASDYLEWYDVALVPEEKLVAVPMIFDLQESWRRGLTLRPDLQQARADIERRNITLRYQKNQLFPALDLVGTYGHNGLNTSYRSVIDDLMEDQNPSYSYGAVLSIPLGNIGPRNRYKASKAEKEQALLQLKNLEKEIMVEIDDTIKLAQSAYDRVQATRQAREFAQAALEGEQKRLETGTSTPFFVLQFQRNLTAARFEEIRALAEYNNALAELAFREGTTLQRHGLDVKVE